MEAAPERNSTLVELETLQNDLLARLDDLDRRVCGVLKEWTSTRKSETLGPSAVATVDVAETAPQGGA